jgi:hypothetical protein
MSNLDLSALDGFGQAPVTKKSTPTLRRHNARIEALNKLRYTAAKSQIERLPAPNESIHFIVSDNYRPWDIIPATIDLLPNPLLSELWITTFSFTQDVVSRTIEIADEGKIRSIWLVCGDMFRKHKPDFFNIIGAEFKKLRYRLVSHRNHSKIILMQGAAGEKFVVEGSANLSACTNAEQLCMTRSEELYDFHRDWIRGIIHAKGPT